MLSYADDIIYPYKPKQVVIYCGENDLAGSDSINAQMYSTGLKYFFQ